MTRMRRKLEANGVEIYNIEIIDLHCDPTLVLGLNGVEQKIDRIDRIEPGGSISTGDS